MKRKYEHEQSMCAGEELFRKAELGKKKNWNDELVEGTKYINIISQVPYTLHKNEDGLWFIDSKLGTGEPCAKEEMVLLLNSKYSIVED